MKTKIVNLKGELYDGVASLVNAKTTSGEITILDNHQPMISIIAENARIYLDDNTGRKEFVVKGGFLHMNGNNELTLLAD